METQRSEGYGRVRVGRYRGLVSDQKCRVCGNDPPAVETEDPEPLCLYCNPWRKKMVITPVEDGLRASEAVTRAAGVVDPEIMRFARARWHHSLLGTRQPRLEFHGAELEGYVDAKLDGLKVTPGTPLRRLRALREKGELNYQVVNRAQSLYRLTWVRMEVK